MESEPSAMPSTALEKMPRPGSPAPAAYGSINHLASAVQNGVGVQPFEFARRSRINFNQVIKAEQNEMLPADDPILGVFAYLDVVLIGVFKQFPPEDENHRIKIAAVTIAGAFDLKNPHSLCSRLEHFDLFFADDRADALARAYFLQKSGASPLDALHGDYTPSWALVALVSEAEIETREDAWGGALQKIRYYARTGDKIACFSTPSQRGLMLLRNGHRAHEVITMCITRVREDTDWIELKKKYDQLGGLKGLLAGHFSCPVFAITPSFK